MAAISAKRPGGRRPSASRTSRRPSAISSASHRLRSWSASSVSEPSSDVRDGPAGVGQQDQGQQAGDVGVVGQEGPQHPGEVERALDQVGADQVGAGRRGVAGGEHQVDDGRARRRCAPGSSSAAGTR